DILRCKRPCEAVFHKKCVKNVECFIQKEVCEECQKRDSPGSSSGRKPKDRIEIDQDDLTIESLLQEVNTKISATLWNSTPNDIKKIIEFKEDTEKKYKALENKNIYLEKQNMALEERILQLEQKEKDKNVEIKGLEKKKDEKIMEIAINMSKILNLKSEEIADARRVGKEKEISGNIYQPLVITCRNKAYRDK
ncbi:unnamed protein product, partial [Leptidea sinapis]